jgi:hypothetical protein
MTRGRTTTERHDKLAKKLISEDPAVAPKRAMCARTELAVKAAIATAVNITVRARKETIIGRICLPGVLAVGRP